MNYNYLVLYSCFIITGKKLCHWLIHLITKMNYSAQYWVDMMVMYITICTSGPLNVPVTNMR